MSESFEGRVIQIGDLVRITLNQHGSIQETLDYVIRNIDELNVYISTEQNPDVLTALIPNEAGQYVVHGAEDIPYEILFIAGPISLDKEKLKEALTGNTLTDIFILSKIDDQTLAEISSANKYISQLYLMDDLWKHKILDKFGSDILNTKPENISLKDYYFDLANPKTFYVEWEDSTLSSDESLFSLSEEDYLKHEDMEYEKHVAKFKAVVTPNYRLYLLKVNSEELQEGENLQIKVGRLITETDNLTQAHQIYQQQYQLLNGHGPLVETDPYGKKGYYPQINIDEVESLVKISKEEDEEEEEDLQLSEKELRQKYDYHWELDYGYKLFLAILSSVSEEYFLLYPSY